MTMLPASVWGSRERLAGIGTMGIALLVLVLRLPYLVVPVMPDEAGFLLVARGWHAGGASLYGDHWVDRPPLLLFLFRAGAALGGIGGVRLLASLGAAGSVLVVAALVRRALGSTRAALVAAGVAGAMLVSPLMGAVETDGELLAAPFVAVGLYAVMVALEGKGGPRADGWALLAGAAGAAALLVKQNLVDVFVFAVAVAGVALARRATPLRPLARPVLLMVGGAGAMTSVVLGAAWLMGSTPAGVYFAMYPFRVAAGQVIAAGNLTARLGRLVHLGDRASLALVPLVLAVLVGWLATRRGRDEPVPAGASYLAGGTLVLVVYAAGSIAVGGSYWGHYLLQLALPTALAAGILAAAARRWTVAVAVAPVLSAAISWTAWLGVTVDVSSTVAGSAVAGAARPGDTVVSLLGSPETVLAAGLPSPTPYLWSLPERTLDRRFTALGHQLASSTGPTWVVVRDGATETMLDQYRAEDALDRHYREVATVCGHRVYLRAGLQRPRPVAGGPCQVRRTG